MYDEGLDLLNEDHTPQGSFEEMTTVDLRLKERRFLNYIPTAVVDNKFLSETSKDTDCFIKRHNSRFLQEQLLSYSYLICKSYNLTSEI